MSFDTEINLSSSLDAENSAKQVSLENSLRAASFLAENEPLQDCEPLYFAILQLSLGKPPRAADFDANLAVSIEENDQIREIALVPLQIAFFRSCGHALRAKLLQDLIMLAKWSAENRDVLLENDEFLQFLLEVLVESQSQIAENRSSNENSTVFLVFFFKKR